MKKLILISLLLSGCTHQVHKEWLALGGSKSDGTVKLGYNQKHLERFQIPKSQAIELATSKCKKWGYKNAEPFGSQIENCKEVNPYVGCVDLDITAEFQCLDK